MIRATALGGVAVLLWSLLAVLTVGAAPIPPLQLNAMCFTIGGMVGALWLTFTGTWHQLRGVPLAAYALGIGGLAGYHLLYFSALRAAPPAEAGLIAYLWPLLIVLLSGLLPGERLRPGHLAGALMGFAGAAVLIGARLSGGADALPGYLLALACALTWSGYSVLSRRFKDVPTAAVTVFCLASAGISLCAHILSETTVLPPDALTWAAVFALGLGPVGLAFFVWDVGVKRGNIQLLGVLSYAAPLLSTAILVLAGLAEPTPALLIAALLIAGGALVAARVSAAAD
ncbi:MAG: EamA family transporter [Pseudomonadota bacterium]